MENLINALQTVISNNLLAKSDSDLARTLGYGGRTNINRIKRNTIGWKALEKFRSSLNDILYINDETLLRMANVACSTSELIKLIKKHSNSKDPDFPFKVLHAFISHDFSFFDRDFHDTTLNDILKLERTDPEALYQILSYLYIKTAKVNFYKGNGTHHERCAAVIEPLGQRFIEIYPENGLGAASAYAYSISKIYNSEAPTLWSLITSMASMLRFFAQPVDTLNTEPDIRRLSGIGDRAYWQGKNPDEVILTWYMPGTRATNGHYEVIKIDRSSSHMENSGTVTFLSDDILTLFSKPDSGSEFGVYSWDGTHISFSWEQENADPMRTGNSWTLLKLDNSQFLRKLDRSLSDHDIMQEVMESEGFESDEKFRISDVIISREKYILEMKNRQRYSIELSQFPFLGSITPSECVIICRYTKDGTLYVIWPAIKHSIPLDMFAIET